MTPYYKEKLEQGTRYQDFISLVLINELGIALSCFNSREYQYKLGENRQGIEIKYDDMFKSTGNIYIEVAEKSNPNNEVYVISGVMRVDNSWLYLIGDYETVFIFGKSTLRKLYKTGRFKEVKNLTSKGFLLNKKQAIHYAEKIIYLENKEVI